jgi:hypothetical protein
MPVATENYEADINLEYEGGLWDDGDAIMQSIAEHHPESITPGGVAVYQASNALVQSSDGNEMSAEFVILTRQSRPNRHGNNHHILPNKFGQGLMAEEFAKNPVVLFEHGFQVPLPIGSSANPSGELQLSLQKTKATSTVYFSQSNGFARDVFGLVDEGIMRSASIGFIPRKAMQIRHKPETLAEGVMDLSEQSIRGLDFTETELFEWSVVSHGADRGALRQCLDRGTIGGEKFSRWMKPVLQSLAEPKKAWSPGMDFRGVQQQSGKPTEAPYRYSRTVGDVREDFTFQSLGEMNAFIESAGPAGSTEPAGPTEPTTTEKKPASTTEAVDKEQSQGTTTQATERQNDRQSAPQQQQQSQQFAEPNEPNLATLYLQRQSVSINSSVVREITQGLGDRIDAAFAPLQQNVERTRSELRRLTGTVD